MLPSRPNLHNSNHFLILFPNNIWTRLSGGFGEEGEEGLVVNHPGGG